MLIAFGSLSKSSVLVRSSIGPFCSFLYFGTLLTETTACSERLAQRGALERPRGLPLAAARFRCCNSAGHCWKRMSFLLLSGRSFFFAHASPLFAYQRPLGVSAYFNNYFNSIRSFLKIIYSQQFLCCQWCYWLL